ncbi:MAG TPA: CdaR family protein [Chloroflexota bacterium]
MAQRAKTNHTRSSFPRSRTFGTAAVTARNRFAWLWTRESLLRLILSFVLSVALWLYVTDKQNPTQAWDFALPISVTAENVPPGLVVTNNLEQIHVRVQADRNNVQVSLGSFHPFVDMQGAKRGLHVVPVHVAADPGIQVLSVTPSTIQVALDQNMQQHVPIAPEILNKPPSGYTLGTISVSPNTVIISGPQTAVSQVTKAVIPLSLGGVTASITGYYKPYLVDAAGATVSPVQLGMQPPLVHVTAHITQLSSFKTLPVIVALSGQPRAGFGVSGVTVSPSSITAYGSPAHLSGVTSVLTGRVSVSRRGQGTFVRRVKLRLPTGIGANTTLVTVRTQIKSVEGSSSVEAAVVPINIPPGLVLHTNLSRVLVTVVGPSNALSSAALHMRATLNLASLSAGTYSLRPVVSVPKGLVVENVYPQQVTVTLTTP